MPPHRLRLIVVMMILLVAVTSGSPLMSRRNTDDVTDDDRPIGMRRDDHNEAIPYISSDDKPVAALVGLRPDWSGLFRAVVANLERPRAAKRRGWGKRLTQYGIDDVDEVNLGGGSDEEIELRRSEKRRGWG